MQDLDFIAAVGINWGSVVQNKNACEKRIHSSIKFTTDIVTITR